MTSDNLSQQAEVMTLAEVATGLGMSWKTIWRLVGKGEVKAHKVGGQWRVTREEYARLVGKGNQKNAPQSEAAAA